ncbi:MAG: phosphotransferase family protein [Hyphomicrobiales bacterium]|nr:phosphotransferase family protein [Hyphomicrobiales bacterium]
MNISKDLDIGPLGAELEAGIDYFSGLREVSKFNTGQSNPTYLLTADSGQYVLRAKPTGTLLKSAHQVDREFRVMRALSGSGVPVPAMLYMSLEDSSIGRMFFVMEYLQGRIFWQPDLPECAIEERSAIYDAMNAALAALHDIDPETIGLADFGKPGNYFERQLSRWTKQYRASETQTISDMDALIPWLEEHLPDDDGQVSLVHGDYRIDNMIFAPDAPSIMAVLDWELSTLGHPLADLAYQCMQWRLPHNTGFRGLGGLDRKAIGLPTEEEYVANYCERRNIDRIDHWPFYLAFSFFRLAAILQGVLKRALDGNASNPRRAKEMAVAVPVMAAMAMDITKGRS